MKLDFFQVADAANVTGNGKLNVLGVFNSLNPQAYPYRHPSMTVIIKFRLELGEYGQERGFALQLRDEDGALILEIPGKLPVTELDSNGRRRDIHLIVQLNNVTFKSPGSYQLLVKVDKDQKGDLTIYAEKPPQPIG
jgi:hypothetical protein